MAIFKIYDVFNRKHIMAIHKLLNIARSKDNQTMKLGQLIEYNLRNNFNEKLYIKCDEKTSPRTFSKKSKLSISLNQVFWFYSEAAAGGAL